MASRVRFSLLALLVGALVGVLAPAAAQAAGFGIEKFFAANCKVATCGEKAEPPTLKEAEEQSYTQAAGHPPAGVTDFKIKSVEASPGLFVPVKSVKNLRIDVAPGVSTDPEAVPKCSLEEFVGKEVDPVHHLFSAPECAEAGPASTVIGENKVLTVLEVAKEVFLDVPLSGKVYNLEQPTGFSSYFGVALEIPGKSVYAHTFIEGHVEWTSDYHDYFEIKNINPGLLESRLVFKGNIGTGGFLANPSRCGGPGPLTTTGISGESYEAETASNFYTALVGTDGCENAVPFAPTFKLTPETTQLDSPDGLIAEVGLPHDPDPEKLDSAQLKTASVTLPEGMTLNPSAATELGSCTPKQIGIGTRNPVECPANSKVGTVVLNVPGLPPESLTGNVYLGGPEGGGAIEAAPYTIYVDAESERYGLSVRLKGLVTPNETTGRLTVTFSENPEQPFTSVVMHLTGGDLAPVANPLACGAAKTETSFTPFTGTAAQTPSSSFVVDSNNEKGTCVSPLPFAPTQETVNQYASAGGHTVFRFTLKRPDGQQYLSRVETILPAGLVGAIPAVTPCTEAQATAGGCPPESLIGTATVAAGSGGRSISLSGSVFLTGPYKGAPYGLFVSVPVNAGPFKLGNAITRATINVEPKTGRVIVGSNLPTIVTGGIPVRLRSVTVEINKPNFLSNPTNCGVLATESTVTGLGSPGTSVNLSSPFQVSNCSALAFKPTFKASTSGTPSKAGGASLETTIAQAAGQANIKSVAVQLPKQLPSRLTTLQKACAAATFEANPAACPAESVVGSARASTPVLPSKLTGQAILVGHAGAAFPDLDLVLDANGVRVILVGNTDIKNGITTTTFASTPDVPVTSITVNLPMGPHSALAANGSLCAKPLVMPTTIVGQNGVTFKQNTIVKANGCGVKIVGHKVIGNTAYITVQTPAAGRVSGSGAGLGRVYRHLSRSYKAATVKVSLTRRGRARHRPFKVRLRVGFLPTSHTRAPSAAFVTVTFR